MRTLRLVPVASALAPASTATRWLPTLALIGLALGVFAIGFHRDASDAVRVWIQSTAYNHCFLILPIVGNLLWERRAVISTCSPRPAFWPLLFIPPLAAAWSPMASTNSSGESKWSLHQSPARQ
jgi:hypothetical protein